MLGFFMGRFCFFDIQIDMKIRLVDPPWTRGIKADPCEKIAIILILKP